MSLENLGTIPLPHLDSILRANFDARSLANRLGGCGYPNQACCHTYRNARDAWAKDPRFRHGLGWLLDRMHAPLLEQVGRSDADLVLAYVRHADYRQHPDFGGLLWALQSDRRAEVRACLPLLLQRVMHDGLRSLSA